jgi:hypothetical protein
MCDLRPLSHTLVTHVIHVCFPLFTDPDEEEEEGYSFEKATAGWTSSDALFLMRTYAALVDAAQAGIQHFATQVGWSLGLAS